MEDKSTGVGNAARIRSETFVRFIEQHEQIGSTNDRAIELAGDSDLPTPALVIAEHQVAGRGRGVNSWHSASGALTFSLLIDRPAGLPPERLSLLSIAAGLAAREAIENVSGLQEVKVKWPNDIYVKGRKLGGILTEVSSHAVERAVIGIGINVNNRFDDAPVEVRQRAVSLIGEMGRRTDPGDLLIAILVQFESMLIEFADRRGVPTELWSPHCLLSGKQVDLRTPNGEVSGHCHGVAEDGALLLEIGQDIRRIYAGEALLFR